MPRALAIIGLVVALGALSAFAAYDRAPSPAWQEIAWPFPRDGWPAGRAFRCGDARCAGLEVYVRPKIGFCNCDAGVADDDEVDRVADIDLISPRFAPLAAGTTVRLADMAGRVRAYQLQMPDQARRVAVGIAVSHRCDLFVAVVQGAGTASEIQLMAATLIETNEIRQWVRTAMQMR
jgi:hypothetical protein